MGTITRMDWCQRRRRLLRAKGGQSEIQQGSKKSETSEPRICPLDPLSQYGPQTPRLSRLCSLTYRTLQSFASILCGCKAWLINAALTICSPPFLKGNSHERRYHSSSRVDFNVNRYSARLASQPQLGLRSERRNRSDRRYTPDTAFARTNLTYLLRFEAQVRICASSNRIQS